MDKVEVIAKVENKRKTSKIIEYIINLLLIIAMALAMYFDIYYKSFSIKHWLSLVIPEEVIHYVLRALGAYGIIQVFAQDIGLKTGIKQKELSHRPLFRFILLWSIAYAITDDGREALFGALLYFYLKHVYSEGKTLDVCFP